jgi:ketosteroid isomerase-like protein
MRILSRLLFVTALFGLMGLSAVEAQDASKATTPAQGTAERKALLDAVRARLKIKSQFKVYHLKVNGDWAFFHGGEVVDGGDGELQETDLDVQVLLQRKTVAGKAAWYVAEIWTLPTDDKLARAEFVRRVRQRQQAGRVPADILPDDL